MAVVSAITKAKTPGVDIPERFAENLTRLRQAAGFSQEELAARAAVHRTQVSLMEGGQRLPRLETLVKLVGALEISSEELLEGIFWVPVVSTPGGFKVVEPEPEPEP
jgi:transcriptional regulator with XRE-family HTH domain